MNYKLAGEIALRLNDLHVPDVKEDAFVQGMGKFLRGEAIMKVVDNPDILGLDITFVPVKEKGEGEPRT